ncbi:protocatechuate 3,4-dioxygenase subunit alpha [Rhodobacterales bacterium HKCCE2091]|nr:protocatechuate 3,4-dioxygenase subunit alpha [Rhodobacterales bacterium HKCCE2091]
MQKIERLKESPSQTAGPYVHIGCTPNFSGIEGVYPEDLGLKVRGANAKGDHITIKGTVYDGTGMALKDTLIEIWQADADGIYPGNDPRGPADPDFYGWGRTPGNQETGEWSFETVKPGRVPGPNGKLMAPHISIWIVARGINLGLQTRMYFPDEEEANAEDPLLNRIEHKTRVPTLIATAEGNSTYRFDIRLQGEGETVFLDV